MEIIYYKVDIYETWDLKMQSGSAIWIPDVIVYKDWLSSCVVCMLYGFGGCQNVTQMWE